MKARIASYLHLTKPSIIALVLVTSLASLGAHGFLFSKPLDSLWILVAIAMAAASANALNQYFDRDIDRIMKRTKSRRPLPQGLLTPRAALLFALVLGVLSTVYLWLVWSPLSAVISLGTIIYYVAFYTLFLKRRHHYNIVIGGAAGSTGPLIAWAAVDGGLSLYAWVMFVIIFMWTPPHFWALALAIKDEYQEVGVPMLPVTHGVKRTKQEIWIYTWSLLPLSLVPWLMGEAGLVYLSSSLALWLWYLIETHLQLPQTDRKNYMRLFGVSILYLLFLFVGILIDGGVRYFS